MNENITVYYHLITEAARLKKSKLLMNEKDTDNYSKELQ